MDRLMRYVELFAGAGGGILAHSILQKWELVAAAQFNPDWNYEKKGLDYASRVLEHHSNVTGLLPPFVLHGDVNDMHNLPYKGIDVVAGGFPCQGLAAPGSKLWLNDPRSALIWRMLGISNELQPTYIFAENSPNLRIRGLHLIVPELQRMGYNKIAWCIIGANQMGAYHERKRMWLLAKKGGPPFIHEWGNPKKIPACGRLIGNKLEPLESVVNIQGIHKRHTLPTLICSDSRASGNRPGDGLWSLSDRLGITAKAGRTRQLPTLLASDYKPAWLTENMREDMKKRSRPLRDMLPYYEGGPGKAINPAWAEWFMGWPVEWTNIDLQLTPAHLQFWKAHVTRDSYWSPDMERTVMPATLLDTADAAHQKNRIIALGNGQVPVVAAAAFDGLKALL
jgi:site-specific DNA-cytosine methylase